MNGPEHYAEAERILKGVREGMSDLKTVITTDPAESVATAQAALDNAISVAQVHATLALVAATANVTHHDAVVPLADRPGPWSNGHQGDGQTWEQVLR